MTRYIFYSGLMLIIVIANMLFSFNFEKIKKNIKLNSENEALKLNLKKPPEQEIPAESIAVSYESFDELTPIEKNMFDESLKINLNTALVDQLMEVDGIGLATAEKIIKYRETHGQFTNIEEIINVPGIGENKLHGFRQAFTVKPVEGMKIEQRAETAQSSIIDLNSADKKTLCTIKGIGKNFAQKIIDYREENNGIKTLEDLLKINGVGEKKIEKIKDFVVLKKYKKTKVIYPENVPPKDINESTYEDIRELPGITPLVGKAIIKYRNKNIRFSKITELKKIDEIDLTTYTRIKKYFYIK